MSFICEEPSTPTPPGHYILVDISEALNEYMQVPIEVRMCGIGEAAEYTAVDMLDVELSSIIPVIDGKNYALPHLREHIEEILEDGRQQLTHELEEQGVSVDERTIPNTPLQLEHAQAIDNLGGRIYDELVRNQLYDEHGSLVGEHYSVLEGGILMLRMI